MTGKQMRKLRRKFELSQEAFGKMIGYAKNSISFIERNDQELTPKMKKLLKIKMDEIKKATP
jgi:DNA-binding XRE family transcriptional regulator